MSKDGKFYYASLEINNVTVEDAGKYRVTAKNELGESNATISLNFDSKSNINVLANLNNTNNDKNKINSIKCDVRNIFDYYNKSNSYC